MNQYTKQAQKFLDDTGTTLNREFDCELKQSAVWADKNSKLTTRRYKVTLERNKRKCTFDFYVSHKDAEMLKQVGEGTRGLPQKVINQLAIDLKNFNSGFTYSFLACINLDQSADFEEFCSNFGYEEDSRRGYKAWVDTLEQNAKLRSMFSDAELELLAEIN